MQRFCLRMFHWNCRFFFGDFAQEKQVKLQDLKKLHPLSKNLRKGVYFSLEI